MITITSDNKIENSLKLINLRRHLESLGHGVEVEIEETEGSKGATVIAIMIVGALVGATALSYQIIKDIQEYTNPKRYSITMHSGNTSATVSNLTAKEYQELLEKIDNKETVNYTLDEIDA